jgi:hypothetical protein
MQLTTLEFRAMNNPVRRYVQKRLEFRLLLFLLRPEAGVRILAPPAASYLGEDAVAVCSNCSISRMSVVGLLHKWFVHT